MYKVLLLCTMSLFYFVFPDLVVRKADIELKSREEEIRFLNMEVCLCINWIIYHKTFLCSLTK